MSEAFGEYIVPAGDNRQLEVREWGDPHGRPVLLLHGTPGGALLRHVDVKSGADVYRERRLRVVTYARPGFGRSTRRPGRRVRDVAQDVEAVADALGLERFAVAGVSGGGPGALAVAALLPSRAPRAVVIAGPAPFGTADLDFFDGMDAEDREWYLRLTKPTAEAELDRECQETLDWVRNDLPRSGLPPGLLKMLQETAEDGLQAGAGGPLDQLVNIFVLFEPSIAHPSDPAAERHASAVQPPRELWGIS